MSRVKKEIREHISLDISENHVVAHFIFPDEFIGFQGHFPLRKVLPGICQIQSVLIMLEKWKGKRISLKEIVNAKFFSPVFPSEKITCNCKDFIAVDEGFLVKASIKTETKKIAEFKLKVSFDFS